MPMPRPAPSAEPETVEQASQESRIPMPVPPVAPTSLEEASKQSSIPLPFSAAMIDQARKIVDWTVSALQAPDGLFDDRRVVATGEMGAKSFNTSYCSE